MIDVNSYRDNGFLHPVPVMSEEEAGKYVARLEELEADPPDNLDYPFKFYKRVNSHYVMKIAADIAHNANILDAVSQILGSDLLCWSCEFFIKEPVTDDVVTWHQDLTYWGLGETDEECTAWLALNLVNEENGCMKMVSGSHKQAIQPHHDTFATHNLLSRGQEVAVEVDEADATSICLAPGEISLHHGRVFHSSGPNQSVHRRIGVAIRYITPDVRQHVAKQDYAMLVRGADHVGNFIHVAAPVHDFDAYNLELHSKIWQAQSTALAAGADGHVPLYANMKRPKMENLDRD